MTATLVLGAHSAHGIEDVWAVHERQLFRHLVALTRDEMAAEDLTQETFLRYTREVAAGRAPDNPGGWLFRVGANLATSRGRRRQVAQRREPVLIARELERSMEPSPEEVLTEAERSNELAEALAGLREIDRVVVLLAAQGFKGPEMAARLGRTHAATRTLLCRARHRLRAQLVTAGFSG